MSSGKQTYIRYNIIDYLFSSAGKKYYTIEEILECLLSKDIDVCARTIENDFRAMRSDPQLNFNAPITHCKYKKAYHYSDPNFSIRKLPISKEQLKMLQMASNILQQFKGMDFFSELEDVVDKVGITVESLRLGEQRKKHSFIIFEEAAHQEGLQHLYPLIKAIDEQQPLTIQYSPFGKTLNEHDFHPYFLKQYKQRWYVIGMSDSKNYIFPLALDRIKDISNLPIKYRPSKIVDPREFFKNVIGISYAQSEAEDIVLSFSPQQGNYIKTQYLHHSQKILVDNEQELRISLHIVPNYEFISILMGYTPDVEVLEPQSLREKVKALLDIGLVKYDKEEQSTQKRKGLAQKRKETGIGGKIKLSRNS